MKIQYTEFVADPSLRNTITNLPAHIAQVLIAQGSAKAVPMPRWGTPEWLEERKAQSAAAVPNAEDTPAPFVSGVCWEIGKSYYGKPVIQRRSGSEIGQAAFGEIPDGCPADVRKQYDKIVREYNARLEAAAQERQAVLEGRR